MHFNSYVHDQSNAGCGSLLIRVRNLQRPDRNIIMIIQIYLPNTDGYQPLFPRINISPGFRRILLKAKLNLASWYLHPM